MQNRQDRPIRLVIEVEGSADPIEGTLTEPATHASRFRGWLALSALIEAARSGDDSAALDDLTLSLPDRPE
jgi:hypothetical protein